MTRAVVLGGGFSGLIAARVLADRFDSVRVIERDVLPDGPVARRGVPQSDQMHVLMLLGQRLLEQFFPGIDRELADRGCPERDQTADVRVFVDPGMGFAPRIPSGLKVRSCSRPMLEAVMRTRVKAMPRVEFVEGETIARIVGTGGAVSRVETTSGRGFDADLVVAALGRNSHLPRWIEELTGQAVEHQVISSRLGYCTRTCHVGERGRSMLEGDVVVPSQYPDNPRGGGARLIENGHVQVTLAGYLGCHPSASPDEFAGYARQLAHPAIAECLEMLEPVSPIHAYKDTANSIHRYDRLSAWPANLVVLGDAFCSLNPFYGQGMTMALVGCALLAETLAGGAGVGAGFQRRAWRRVRPFFSVATRLDAQWARLERGRPGRAQRVMFRLKAALVAESYRRREDTVRFTEARNHLRTPLRALTPSLVARTLARLLRRR